MRIDINSDGFALTIMFASGVLIAIIFILAHLKTARRMRAFQTWPRVSAQVLESGTARWTNKHHRPVVRYGYQVQGRTYVSDQLTAAQIYSTSRNSMQAIADRYPVGAQIEIGYDPGNPSYALLEAGRANRSMIVMAVLGATLAGVTGIALVTS